MPNYNLRINGFARSVDASDPEKPLLYVLRGLGLTATKFGCGLGQCGACTVLLDGKAIRSCQTTVANAQGKTVTTLEGLGSASAPHPIQAGDFLLPICGVLVGLIAFTLLDQRLPPARDDGIGAALSSGGEG